VRKQDGPARLDETAALVVAGEIVGGLAFGRDDDRDEAARPGAAPALDRLDERRADPQPAGRGQDVQVLHLGREPQLDAAGGRHRRHAHHLLALPGEEHRALVVAQQSQELRAHLAEALKRVERMGALHMLAVLPGFFAMSQFEELYAELFEGASTLDALQLLQGFDNKTIEADRALWQLSRTALASPEVKEVLTNCSARDVLTAIENTVQGRRFLATLQTWLHQYGQRLSSVFALLEPDWIEDPTVVIEYLKAYVAQPDAGRETDQAARVAEREKAVADARARLTSYPQPVRDQFETLLKAAQTAAVVHEDHNYWIDQRLFYHVRQLILEFGRRFAETGALDAVDDVFYLTPEELHESREILAGQGEEKAQNRSLQQCVRERKAEMEHYSRVTAPPMLGTMPPFEMDDGGPVLRAFFKGDFNPQENGSSDPSVVNGLAGSAGIVRGKARVIRSLAEAGKLQKGDILVTEFTVPPWTPLFATAGAIVTDIGGVLSHSAVVAREYRIPAVVGTGHATTTFHDGQLLEVDGNAGVVRVVASP